MIPKPGKDVLNPKNFRPISHLNPISKVFERLLLNRIQYHSSHLIRHVQHGFRHNHSTSIQLLTVIDDIVNNFNKRIKFVAALLDIEKAFDKVLHDGLIFKLSALNLPVQLINIIKSFFSNR
jgi:hypothetical protein|uniref:RNA-directed DNA polymerase from mobile element jockey n=1 Tax=Sipha flava TaxID=143950 RepID=A0A2S2PUZ1_9HEMI